MPCPFSLDAVNRVATKKLCMLSLPCTYHICNMPAELLMASEDRNESADPESLSTHLYRCFAQECEDLLRGIPPKVGEQMRWWLLICLRYTYLHKYLAHRRTYSRRTSMAMTHNEHSQL